MDDVFEGTIKWIEYQDKQTFRNAPENPDPGLRLLEGILAEQAESEEEVETPEPYILMQRIKTWGNTYWGVSYSEQPYVLVKEIEATVAAINKIQERKTKEQQEKINAIQQIRSRKPWR